MTITTGIVWTRNRPATDGARLCEPQYCLQLSRCPPGPSGPLREAKLLRVIDPRSGARLCEPQPVGSSRCMDFAESGWVGEVGAGRRAAVRSAPPGGAARSAVLEGEPAHPG